jgi:hypothetical protein
VAVGAALLLGSLTHVVWDAFTHVNGWAVERLPVLRADFGPLPVYRWAQYLNGVLGGLFVVAWITRWWRIFSDTVGGSWYLSGAASSCRL